MNREMDKELKKIKCVICLLAACEKYRDAGKMDIEMFYEISNKLECRIMQSPNRWRLVCGPEHYDEVVNTVKAIQAMKKEPKCLNSKCTHTQGKHVLGTGACEAARCKCLAFATQQFNPASLTNSADGQKLLEKLRADAEALMMPKEKDNTAP